MKNMKTYENEIITIFYYGNHEFRLFLIGLYIYICFVYKIFQPEIHKKLYFSTLFFEKFISYYVT